MLLVVEGRGKVNPSYKLGIDIGSTTVKIAILDREKKILYYIFFAVPNFTPHVHMMDFEP